MSDYTFGEAKATVNGKTFTFRELTVDENDEVADAATGPDGKWNGRLALRHMIALSSVEPKLTLAEVGKMPLSTYNAVSKAVNDVNSGDLPADESDPND